MSDTKFNDINQAVNDYSNFPFDDLSIDQIAQLMMDEIQAGGDPDFINACREQLAKRNPKHESSSDTAVSGGEQ